MSYEGCIPLSLTFVKSKVHWVVKCTLNKWTGFSTKQSFFFCIIMPSLNITVINAFDLRETEFFGSKQDPYVIVRSDMDTRQTRVNMDGGRNPGSFWGAEWFLVWNEVLTVSYNNPTANLEFTMCVSISSVIFRMNKNMMRDMLIGRATYSISQVLASGYAG